MKQVCWSTLTHTCTRSHPPAHHTLFWCSSTNLATLAMHRITAAALDEEEGVSPLLHTVVDILRLRETSRDSDGCRHSQTHTSTGEAPGASAPPAVSTFLLAFARRNISIERVLDEAESLGLAWRLPDDFEPASVSENVYLMTLR